MQTIRYKSLGTKFDTRVAPVRRGSVLIALALAALAAILSPITAHAQVNLFVSVNGASVFTASPGSVFEYTPAGMQITFVSGIKIGRPRGLAFDSSGNLFVGLEPLTPSDNPHGKLLKFSPLSQQSVLGNAANHAGFEGVVTDSAGNVFALASSQTFPFPGTIYKFTPNGTRTVFGNTPGQSFGLAFDSAGNLYAADSNDAIIYKFAPDGTRTIFAGPSAFTSTQGPTGLAFDSAGNLFVTTEGNPGNDAILKFTSDGLSESTFATGLTQPRGLAFDGSGNLYVAETHADGDILEFTPAGGTGTVFASGIARPEFLTFGPAR
jgi:hypothetical protein